MFIGHYALGFAAKRAAPQASLGVLMAAPVLLDLVWPVLVLAGIERVRVDPGNTDFTPLSFDYYPFSHSLLGTAMLGAIAALVYWGWARYAAGAVAVFFGVASHWVLDAIAHRPDLPLGFDGRIVIGAGLWDSVPATMIVEGALFAFGVWMYATDTRARDRTGVYGFWSFVALAALIYIGNALGPPPPSATSVAILGLAQWIVPFWAFWFDRHRDFTTGAQAAAAAG